MRRVRGATPFHQVGGGVPEGKEAPHLREGGLAGAVGGGGVDEAGRGDASGAPGVPLVPHCQRPEGVRARCLGGKGGGLWPVAEAGRNQGSM